MKKILLADDDEAIVDATSLLLEMEGFEVSATRSGHEVMGLAKQSQPDIILLDIWMSGVDGREVCRQIKADNDLLPIPVLMISASREGRQSALDAGASDFVEKPFETDHLLSRINALLQ